MKILWWCRLTTINRILQTLITTLWINNSTQVSPTKNLFRLKRRKYHVSYEKCEGFLRTQHHPNKQQHLTKMM